jgi:catechol 2,3-dioxygenase-like lactoylglutathione lyase family enzyme
MLKQFDAIATLPAQDIKRARAFYEEKLGFSPVEISPDGSATYETGSTRFLVFPTMGKPSGDHTQMGFNVEDLAAVVGELKQKGVKLEEYDLPGFKTTDGIVDLGDERAAWFKDSEGNLLSLAQRAQVPAGR